MLVACYVKVDAILEHRQELGVQCVVIAVVSVRKDQMMCVGDFHGDWLFCNCSSSHLNCFVDTSCVSRAKNWMGPALKV